MKKYYILSFSLLLSCLTSSAQWSTDISDNLKVVPTGTNLYANDVKTGPNGTTWFYGYRATGADEYNPETMTYSYTVQAFDKDGYKLFDDEYGKLVSNYRNRSWCAVNDHLFVDKDDNAILAVSDYRNCNENEELLTYTAYKINPKGEMLWGEDGLDIDIYPAAGKYAVDCVQIEDGSYIFAWTTFYEDIATIEMQRVSSEGELLWDVDQTRMYDPSISHQYPILVNAGDNQIIIVYQRGSNNDLYARKIDFDGSSVWEKDARIYRGGWGSIPAWTRIDVKESGDGGVIVGWNDDRYYENKYSPYMAYITSEGKLGFATDDGDTKLTYAGINCFDVKVLPTTDDSGFIAMFRQYNSDEYHQGVMIQKISKNGELLWGDNAIHLTDASAEHSVGYLSMQHGDTGEAACFYMTSNSGTEVNTYITTIDETSGETTATFTFMEQPDGVKSNLISRSIPNEKCWIAYWMEGLSSKDYTNYCLQRINFDGSIGSSGIESIESEQDLIYFKDNVLYLSDAIEENVKIEIFDLTCKKLSSYAHSSSGGIVDFSNLNLSSGIYIIKASTELWSKTLKIVM